jgi:choline kinase
MRAIILAAGKGSRISNNIGDIPKSLLDIEGEKIIERSVRLLQELGIKVSVCVGYKHSMIEDVLKNKNVNTYYNPFYEVSNNIASLWFAREEFLHHEAVIILSADLIYDVCILKQIADYDASLLMATDSSRISDGDYFFTLDSEGNITNYGPNIPLNERTCEYVGICKISKDASNIFCTELDKFIDQGKLDVYFENVFFSFINDDMCLLKTIDVSGKNWMEIDYYKDYKKALVKFEEDKTCNC